jgi:Phage terminase, small subunit
MAGNSNSGRRPEPTALTLLRGNPSKKRLNAQEPTPPPGEVVKPAGLTPGADLIWEWLAPVCLEMGTLTRADVAAFMMLCELEATIALAREWKATPRKRLAGLKLEKELAPIVRPYYALFGLDPVSRAKIQVPKKPAAPVSKWAGMLP